MKQEQHKNMRYRPALSFFHANAKGTGSAVRFELRPATEMSEGCVFVSLAKQLTLGDFSGRTRQYATFDWDNKICVKLSFDDLCQMLQVLHGECESMNGDKGLFHSSASATAIIRFRHDVERDGSYRFEVRKKVNEAVSTSAAVNGGGANVCSILFSRSEALGLCEVIRSSMSAICFGNICVGQGLAAVVPVEHATRQGSGDAT